MENSKLIFRLVFVYGILLFLTSGTTFGQVHQDDIILLLGDSDSAGASKDLVPNFYFTGKNYGQPNATGLYVFPGDGPFDVVLRGPNFLIVEELSELPAGTYILSTSKLPAGIYTLTVEGAQVAYTVKIMFRE